MTSGREPRSAAPKRWRALRWARRASQSAFLAAFLLLVFATASITGAGFDAAAPSRVTLPVEVFLQIDPLIGAIVLLAGGSVPGPAIFGLLVLASAAFLGRGFCGWICPMGTMNHAASAIRPGLSGKRRMEANRTRPYQKAKYAILAGVLAAALLGSGVGGLLDPMALATRGVSLTFLPLINWLAGSTVDAAAASNVLALQRASDALYDVTADVVFYQRGLIVGGGVLVSLFFVAALAANRWIPRFWCRGLCPLGAMLGLSGRFGALTLIKDEEACDDCGLCTLNCSGAASPRPGEPWQRSECDLCMNCVAVCPRGALRFGLAGRETDERPWPDLRRRTVVAGAVAGAAMVPLARTGTLGSPRGRPDPACIRPPGALDEEGFLERCVRCGQCMKICPNNALHPALDEAGIEGLWTPVLVPRIGYCEPSCTLCTQVCPTAAIRRVTENQKTGAGGEEMIRVGTAFLDRGRCLPWAMGTACTVCEEFCPISPKAVWTKDEEIVVRGEKVRVKLPYVDPAACNGCGACEWACPVHDEAAIRVTAAGETRSPTHALLLGDRPQRAGDR